MHVIIIGGGIGGLALAQALKKSGISVAVYERDRTRSDRLQGYRISIREFGSRALYECLPRPLFDAFVSTCGEKGRGIRFMTEELKELLYIQVPENQDDIDGAHSVSRITLRQVLLAGLDDIVAFDKRLSRYEERPGGKVTAFFEDGTQATGDILVGADGVHSRVRTQLLPHADPIDTGILGIAGKVPLSDNLLSYLPQELFDGPMMVSSRGGSGAFISLQRFKKEASEVIRGIGGNDDAIKLHPGLLFDNTSDYLMWGFMTKRERYQFPRSPETLSPQELCATVLTMMKGYHPTVRRFVSDADPGTIALLPIRSAPEISHWESRTVTVLGDAIHSMTPAAGVGANTAIKDASCLCKELVAASRGEKPLLQAIHDYEVAMLRYGFEAVRQSLRNAMANTNEKVLPRLFMRSAMRAVNVAMKTKRGFSAITAADHSQRSAGRP